MTSIKTVLIEMLSTFEAKGKMGAKQLREQLHQAWPVPDSRAAIEQLRRELKDEMKQSLEVVSPSSLPLSLSPFLPSPLPSLCMTFSLLFLLRFGHRLSWSVNRWSARSRGRRRWRRI